MERARGVRPRIAAYAAMAKAITDTKKEAKNSRSRIVIMYFIPQSKRGWFMTWFPTAPA
jgi:hypothetical protein